MDEIPEHINEAKAEESEPRRYGIGGSLNWDSQLKPIALAVELPFWLLIPPCHFEVNADGAQANVIVENAGIQILKGQQFTRSQRNSVFIGSEEALQNATIPAGGIVTGGFLRGTNTLLYIEAFAIEDALDAFFGPDGPRWQDGHRYFASLVRGQLSIINRLINAYRRAAVDPLTRELTEVDLPTWFVCDPPRTRAVTLHSWAVQDWYPTIGSFGGGNQRPFFAAGVEDVEHHLRNAENPGEIELLDGWSLFQTGRYSDAIRCFVTAIEVLLEAELRRILTNAGKDQGEIRQLLLETRNNFEQRLEMYSDLTKRRVPGPLIHPVPYVNGIRLADEMKITRELRHLIVHGGYRLDHRVAKPMQRAAETTSWLFDWLANGGDFEERRRKHSVFFFGNRPDVSLFECDTVNGQILVQQPGYLQPMADDVMPDLAGGEVVYTPQQFLRTLDSSPPRGKDLELFAKMAFCELGLGEVEDSAYSSIKEVMIERFCFMHEERRVGVYLLDTKELIKCEHIEAVYEIIKRSVPEDGECRTILLANTEQNLPWFRRGIDVASDVAELAKRHNIALVSTSSLARAVLAVLKNRWSKAAILSDMIEGGQYNSQPPYSCLIGRVIHYWPKIGVLGIQPAQVAPPDVGARIAIELATEFVEDSLSEVRVDEAGLFSFLLTGGHAKLPADARVYALDADRTYEPQREEVSEIFAPGQAVAHAIVHPGREPGVGPRLVPSEVT